MPETCCIRNCRSLLLVHNIYVWIFFFMVSHTIMTIIQCMIMAYVLTHNQVLTKSCSPWTLLSPGLLVTMMSSPSLAERIILLPFMATSFLNAWLAGTMTHCNRSILLLLSLVSMSRAVHTFFIRNYFIRNLYWDSQIAEKLSVLNPFATQFLAGKVAI